MKILQNPYDLSFLNIIKGQFHTIKKEVIIMSKFYLLCLFLISLSLFSCTPAGWNGALDDEPYNISGNGHLNEKEREYARDRCITNLDRFIQGQADDLYGKECFEGRSLVVKVSEDGTPVASSASINQDAGTDALRLEGELSFINKMYKAEYSVLEGKGSDKNITFLKDFLPLDQEFISTRSGTKKYNIIFKIEGSYLILYKASTDFDDIPYTERTAMEMLEDGSYKKSEDGYYMEMLEDGSYEKSEDGYYRVPFMGYPIEYCSARVSLFDGRETNELESVCEKVDSENAKYIRVRKGTQQLYRYVEEKQDLFPAEYFDGEWFVTSGYIEGVMPNALDGSDILLSDAYLVEFDPQTNYLNAIDVSGDVKDEKNKRNIINFIPIIWQKYEMKKEGDRIVSPFQERVSPKDSAVTNWPYLRINAKKYTDTGREIVDFLVSEDFFSFTWKRGPRKYKVSLLRKSAVDEKGFSPRRWFRDDHDHHFGILNVEPQWLRKRGQISEEELQSLFRMVHFNINSQKTIKWYFSKNSAENSSYRNIAKEAVQIYDQAFRMITNGKVRVELIEDDEKDLGDFRYNIINLVKSEDDSGGSGLLGVAPDYVNPDTGQVIGGTANVFINSILEIGDFKLRHYIRYEIFQKAIKSEKENKAHAVSDHLRNLIENRCPEIAAFIEKEKQKNRKPMDNIGDTELYKACSEKISKEYILQLILHEMGHNFGLGHNFQASTDKDNYYQSVEEMKKNFSNAAFYEDLDSVEIAKSSSVMDYLPNFDVPPMTALGRYDLAALRFLYMGQIEMPDGEIVSLNIPEDPGHQKKLSEKILSQRKAYRHCSDSIRYNSHSNVEDGGKFICRLNDYGSSHLEMLNFIVEKFNRNLNTIRYRYDAQIREPTIVEIGTHYLGNLEKFYQRWIFLRDQYLSSDEQSKSKYFISEDEDFNEARMKDYKKLIPSDNKEEEHKKFYNVRDPIYKFFLEVLSLETMKCKVADDKNTYTVDLELIKKYALEYILSEHRAFNKADFYVENCYSEMIKNFLSNEGLTLVGQRGLENFKNNSYFEEKGDRSWDWSVAQAASDRGLFFDQNVRYLTSFTKDPDLFHDFRKNFEETLINQDDHSKTDLDKIYKIYKQIFVKAIKKHREDNKEDQRILKNNTDYLKTFQFFTSTTRLGSFYDKVQEPLNGGASIETVGIPFLTEHYKKYEKLSEEEKQNINFEKYIINSGESVVSVDEDSNPVVIVPFQSNSIILEIIKKYNQNQKKVEELNNLERNRELTFLEVVDRQKKLDQNETFFKILDELWSTKML